MANVEIRKKIATEGIRYWRVAEKLGISDGAFSRKLRRELSEPEKQRVLQAINDAATERRTVNREYV